MCNKGLIAWEKSINIKPKLNGGFKKSIQVNKTGMHYFYNQSENQSQKVSVETQSGVGVYNISKGDIGSIFMSAGATFDVYSSDPTVELNVLMGV